MASLNLKTFPQLVQEQAAAMQAKCAQLVDFAQGAILRAIAESNAAIALWLQADFLQVLATTRLATSTGSDVDTFVNDYGVTRLGATAATGAVTFGRFTSTVQAVIPVGAVVQTADASQQFTVVLDPTNSAYSASLGGFIMPIGVSTTTVLVKANLPAAVSNVVAGAISLLSSSIPNVDYCFNAAALAGGADAESDAQLRARFRLFIASLSKATDLAVLYAINSLHLGVQSTVTECQNYTNNTYRPGYFYVVVDDGTGTPPQSLLDLIGGTVNVVRGLGLQFDVFPPVILRADVQMIVTSGSGYDHTEVVGAVGDAVITYINELPLGKTLSYHKLSQVAFNAHPGVDDITGYFLNGSTGDIPATNKNLIKANTVAVS